jgi:hypothetical protein
MWFPGEERLVRGGNCTRPPLEEARGLDPSRSYPGQFIPARPFISNETGGGLAPVRIRVEPESPALAAPNFMIFFFPAACLPWLSCRRQ